MDDWKVKARAVVKLKEKPNVFVSLVATLILLHTEVIRINQSVNLRSRVVNG